MRKRLFLAGIALLLGVWLFGRETFLMAAVQLGSLQSARILLTLGADPNAWSKSLYPNVRRDDLKAEREETYSSHTPLMIAAKQGRADIARVLLEHGALVNVVDDAKLDATRTWNLCKQCKCRGRC